MNSMRSIRLLFLLLVVLAARLPHSALIAAAPAVLGGNSAIGSLDFGNVPQGASPVDRVVYLRNDDTLDMWITSVSVTGAQASSFSVTPNPQGTAGWYLAQTDLIALRIRYQPNGPVGSASATLLIGSKSGNNSASASINPERSLSLSAATVAAIAAPRLSLTRRIGNVDQALTSLVSEVDLGLTANSSLSLTLANTGTATLNLSAPTLQGAAAADFTLDSPNSISLAAGSTQSLTVNFTPQPGSRGERRALLLISDAQTLRFALRLKAHVTQQAPSMTLHQVQARAWGSNDSSQTQLPASAAGSLPVQIAASSNYSLLLDSNGVIRQAFREAGQDLTGFTPPSATGFKAIAAGPTHALAINSSDTVVAWFNGADPSNTVPAGLSGVRAVAAGGDFSLALMGDGSIRHWGVNTYGVGQIPALSGMSYTAVAAGLYHGLALRSDGAVVAWGFDYDSQDITVYHGQATVPLAAQSDVVAIAAGAQHNVVIKADGKLVAWGDDRRSQCTIPAAASGRRAVSVSAGLWHSMAVFDDGSILSWGDVGSGLNNTPSLLEGASSIAAGHVHSALIQRREIRDIEALHAPFNPVPYFGSPVTAATSSATFEMRNDGNVALNNLTLEKTGDLNDFDIVGPAAPSTLAIGALHRFSVQFKPQQLGLRRARLTLRSSGTLLRVVNLHAVAYDGNSQAPGLVIQDLLGNTQSSGATLELDRLGALGLPNGKILALRNLGGAPVTTLSASLTDDANGVFSFSAPFPNDALPALLSPGETALILSVLRPTMNKQGPLSARLEVSSGNPVEKTDINLRASSVAPEITVLDGETDLSNGSQLSMGNLNRINDTARLTRLVILRNDGSLPLNNLQTTFGGTDAADFTISGLGSQSLAPGGSLLLSIAFQPPADRLAMASARSASLTIASDDSDESNFTLNLSASLIYPEISLERNGSELTSGDLIEFGDVRIGTSSPTQTITVRNLGSTPLQNLALLRGDLGGTGFNVSVFPALSLNAGQSASFTITFSPALGSAQSTREQLINLISSDADEPSFSLRLKGRAVQPQMQLRLSAGGAVLGNNAVINAFSASTVQPQQTSSVEFVISNPGWAGLSDITASLGGPRTADFSISGMPSQLGAESESRFLVVFAPTAGPVGTRAASLIVRSTSSGLTWTGNLSATSLSPMPNLTQTSTVNQTQTEISSNIALANGSGTASFGNWDPKFEQPIRGNFRIGNTGNQPLEISALSIEGTAAADFTLPIPISGSVPAGGALSFAVNFLPTSLETPGTRTARLVASLANASPQSFSINLLGTRLARPGQISLLDHRGSRLNTGADGALHVGFVGLGRPAPGSIRTITLRNDGNQALQGLRVTLGGPNAADFRVGPFFPVPAAAGLAAGSSIQFTLEYYPKVQTAAAASATLTVSASNAIISPEPFHLRGQTLPRLTQATFLGDGLSDNGNDSAVDRLDAVGGRGRLNEGPIWLDWLALPSLPWASAGGNNLARVGTRLVSPPSTPNFADQVTDLLGSVADLSNRHLIVWVGSHDLEDITADAALSGDASALSAAIDQRMAGLRTQLQRLQGAASLWVMNQIPSAIVPRVIQLAPELRDAAIAAQRLWNDRLAALCTQPEVNARLLDVEAMVVNALARPADYGLPAINPVLFREGGMPNSLLHGLISRQICIVAQGTPEIALQSGSTVLLTGRNLLNFAPQPLQPSQAQSLSLVITNTGTSDLNGLNAVLTGDPSIVEASRDNLLRLPRNLPAGSGNSTTLTLNFLPNAQSSNGGIKQAQLNLYSSDRDEPVFTVQVRGAHIPKGQVVRQNAVLNLGPLDNSSLGSPAATMTWKLNNKVIGGEVANNFYRDRLAMGEGGTYSVDVRDALGRVSGIGPIEVVVVENNFSNPRRVVVANNATSPISLAAQFTASTAAAPGLTFQWLKSSAANFNPESPEGLEIPSANQRNLVVPNGNDTSGMYYCRVSWGDSSVIGSCHEVIIVNAKPVISNAGSAAEPWLRGTLGQWMEARLPSDGTADFFAATGLPAGLVLNRETGVISGFPSALRTDRAGNILTNEVSFTARNNFGTSTASKAFIRIDPLPNNAQLGFALVGNYLGFTARHPVINGNLGGRVEFAVTTRGQISGRLVMGSGAFRPFVGGFARHATQWQSQGLTLPASPAGPALSLSIIIDAEGASMEITQPQAVGAQSQFLTLWRQQPAPATRMGRYGMAFLSRQATEAGASPAGSGYATMSVSNVGIYMLTGRTPDGETLTQSGVVGPEGEFGIFQALYTTPVKGSILGNEGLRITDLVGAADPMTNHHRLSGSLSLNRPANTALPHLARVYRSGFNITSFDILGGMLPTLGADMTLFGPPQESGQIPLRFNLPIQVTDLALLQGYGVRMGPGSRTAAITRNGEVLSAAADLSDFKLTATQATGAITGSFMLVDGSIKRMVTFQGQVIRHRPEDSNNDQWIAHGYLLLDQLPQAGQASNATPRISLPWSLSPP